MKSQNLVYLRTIKPDFRQILIDLAIYWHLQAEIRGIWTRSAGIIDNKKMYEI